MRTCVVIGAGGSLADALYFRGQRMKETRPPLDTTFFRTVYARKIPLSEPLRAYFRTVIGVDPTASAIGDLRMEQVFADAFFDFRETPSNKGALDAYIDLVDLYLRVLRETTNWLCADKRRGAPIGRLLADAAEAADDLTIITFNHDLVIENEINRRVALRQRWCIDEGYGKFSKSMTLLTPGSSRTPVFQKHSDGHCNHDRLITLLKLHGSLNWTVRLNSERPSATLLSGGSHGDVYLLSRRQLLSSRQTFNRRRQGPGRTRWMLWPVVVPPVYAKQGLRGAVHQTWTDATAALETADRLTIFGYSLPAIDFEAEKLFERALRRNTALRWVDVINPDPTSASRFASLTTTSPIRWYPSTADFKAAGSFSV